jgi:antitoxin HicB
VASADSYHIEIFALSTADGGGFVAIAPDLPGCISDGETQEEAIANLHRAIDEWIAEARTMGRKVPEPVYYAAA